MPEDRMRMRLYSSPASWSLALNLLFAVPATLGQMDRAIYISPISEVPLTAVVKLEHTHVGSDGKRISVEAIETIARDTHGRMYRDVWKREPASGKLSLLAIDFYEPAINTYTTIDPIFKTFWIGRLDRQPAIFGDGFFYDPHDDGSPASQLPHGKDIGIETLHGVPVHHIREIDPVRNNSAEQTKVTREYWYSDDLRMNLASRLNDPKAVFQTMTVTQLTRKEPDASIYKVPAGYRRVDTLYQLHVPPL
jgi:hypothetical protein